jgi:myo-inositol-1(or 4)-monophosphatase
VRRRGDDEPPRSINVTCTPGPVVSPPVSAAPSDPEGLLPVLLEGAAAVRTALEGVDPADRRRSGSRPGQYAFDLVTDEALRTVLHGAGLGVLSEESGRTGPESDLLVVVDPVDGSTNAALGIPWYATSLCILDGAGPLVGLVVQLVSGVRHHAVRGEGAYRDGVPIRPSATTELPRAVVGISGFPRAHPGWSQFRALGAASLDICAVADGSLDAYRVVGRSALSVWDYVAAMLVCTEAGAVVTERDGLDLVVRDGSPRRPIAAATATLLAQLSAADV